MTRRARFERLLNFELPYHELDPVLRILFEQFIGKDEEIAPKLYLSASDLRRCQDAGLEIGIHGHSHRVLSRLTEDEQRVELGTCVEALRTTCGLTELHARTLRDRRQLERGDQTRGGIAWAGQCVNEGPRDHQAVGPEGALGAAAL